MKERISIIIPIYNVEKYLEKCINSIIHQTYKNLEIILIDDGSSDGCGKICDEYAQKDNRIKVIHKKNGGVSSARNAGLDVATGEYISFVDPDDYIETDMYEYILEEMQDGNFDIIEFNYYNVYEDGNIKEHGTKNKIYTNFRDVLFGMFTYNIFFGITKVYKKSAIGNNRFDSRFKISEDTLFFYECIKNITKMKSVDRPVYYYFNRSDSVVHKKFHKGAFDTIKVLELIKDECKDDELLMVFYYYYINKCLDVLQNIIVQNKYVEELNDIRNKIISNRKFVFNSKPFAINGGTRCFGKSVKLYVLLLWICPKLVYKLHPWYLRMKGKNNNR